MRRLLTLLLLGSGWIGFQPQGPLRAQETTTNKSTDHDKTAHHASGHESPLVPPWGRDLEAEHPIEKHEHGGHHGEALQRREWRFTAEYWSGWSKNDRIPVLLTTGATADPRPGALGQAFTRGLYGDAVDYEDRPGGRFTLEAPLGRTGDWALSLSYHFLDSRTVGPREASPGTPVLARPFFDVRTGLEDSSLVTFPGLASGSIAIQSDSLLQSGEVNVVRVLSCHEHRLFALIAGVRYLDLDENLSITETSKISPTAAAFPGRTITVSDRFGVDNEFIGGQIGGLFEWKNKRWTTTVISKVAVGNVHREILIGGRTTIDTAPATDVPAGLLALSTNSGRFSRDTFAVVPELGMTIGLQITERLSIRGGYTFLYWNRIVRPGEQIDRNLNPNLIPTSASFGGPATPALPAAQFRTNDYWVHGMTWGLEFRY